MAAMFHQLATPVVIRSGVTQVYAMDPSCPGPVGPYLGDDPNGTCPNCGGPAETNSGVWFTAGDLAVRCWGCQAIYRIKGWTG